MSIKENIKDEKVPLNFSKLQRIKHKMYYKSDVCSFYNTKQYYLNKLYKPLCQL